jgi:uroporphyrinogen-III synthase
MRFYQSLDVDQYSRLTNADKFIDQQYLVFMLHDYFRQCGEAKYKELMGKLNAAGVNTERLQAYQRSYEQAMQQQAAQAAAPAEEESSISLEEALGN